MGPPSSLVTRLKVQLKLGIARLRMVQQKDVALAKQQRRAMAQLIEQGKIESARIRVENIIRSDITTELHEYIELYCELLLARSQLLDPPPSTTLSSSSPAPTHQCDPALEEAVRTVIHAAPRTEIKELHSARALLVEKFGREYSTLAMEGEGVPDRVLKKLKVESPSPELVDAYLREIARTYQVPFPGVDTDEDEDEDDGGIKELEQQVEPPLEAETKTGSDDEGKADETRRLSQATPPRKIGTKPVVGVAPQSPSSENVTPSVKLPGPPTELRPSAKMKKAETKKPEGKGKGPGGSIPDVDELSKRFAALKR
ncbi:DUF292-domain-containing protein [Eremomyces bilateralis CBS 781.70]|uniref:DUF292-domain-containing protein n=1 Tax=Eremomyces bilateralis CBS 781.70 TaxID=1392243 RepID=A0A6G1FTS9_9PEZI|nr:DUF292-domain-containing protein [Eremomyces bilateralis CBS 781.70]KAF1809071.1 DUF292-domain-containing protein [Eremomyces bilateralis CBS 781.70]